MKLSTRQKAAMTHTCKLPEECEHPRFGFCDEGFGIRLTLNSGFE